MTQAKPLAAREIPSSLDAMLAAWNERDPSRIRGHLEAALAPDVYFVDPANEVTGLDAFEAMVRELRKAHPKVVSARTSGVDLHHGRCRYTWRVTFGDGRSLDGMDVTTLDGDGKVTQVDGFFGPFPGMEAR